MDKKHMTGILVLAVCAVMATGAYAFGGFGMGQGNDAMRQALEANDIGAFREAVSNSITEEMFGHMAQRFETRQAIQDALEANNYEAWAEAIESRPKITDFVTEDNFERYAAMLEARNNGDLETAREIAEELGLPFGMGRFMNHPRGIKNGFGKNQAWQGIGEDS
ncbi:MAG: hypothetical protein JW744_05880 [Candidatus Diapherotrites archaeon]|uniref:Uncharacterized protein n=1 Tax=Candidatus Iainarchaeum sp. TaxID=3101447 RepID=A0A939CAP2_9ARCH|nr:hypothetical protein [Candidatus Diapherotrites archaeon]